jgi:hypothetical protein
MNARARINIVVHGPIRTLSPVGERARDFLKAWVERQVVTNGILSE